MQNEDFNINDIAAKFLAEKTDTIGKLVKEVYKNASNEFNLVLKTKYTSYLEAVLNQYGKTRTFFIRDYPRPISSFYVPIGLECNTVKYQTVDLKLLLVSNRFIIISGSGGAGKSILLKYLFLKCLESKYKIPVFIEIRDIGDEFTTIRESIKQALYQFHLDLEDDYYEKSLERGHYIIFLDGLDEVNGSIRDKITKDVEAFSRRYNSCDILLTTRPEDRTSALTSFTVYQTSPLDLSKSIELISKLPAEEEVKRSFIKELQEGLFEEHKSFLSNPLLLSIMLLTYGYSADIPNRTSIFYNQAYEALFTRHDALKGAFKRDKETSLNILDFEKVLSAFCILTYDKKALKFSRTEALTYISNSKALTGLDFDIEGFLNDLLQSVCILLQDGLFLTFTHRTFQEYFAAKFIVSNDNETKLKLIYKYGLSMNTDNVYDLIYDLDTDFFETQVILPFINTHFDKISLQGEVTEEVFLKHLKLLWDDLEIIKGNIKWYMADIYSVYMIDFIYHVYKDIIPLPFSLALNYSDAFNDILEKSKTKKSGDTYSFIILKTTDSIFNILYQSRLYSTNTNIDFLIVIKQHLESKYKSKAENLNDLLLKKS